MPTMHIGNPYCQHNTISNTDHGKMQMISIVRLGLGIDSRVSN